MKPSTLRKVPSLSFWIPSSLSPSESFSNNSNNYDQEFLLGAGATSSSSSYEGGKSKRLFFA